MKINLTLVERAEILNAMKLVLAGHFGNDVNFDLLRKLHDRLSYAKSISNANREFRKHL